MQTFGDYLNFNPHCHVLCTDGSFFDSGAFRVAPPWDADTLEKLLQHNVLSMLLHNHLPWSDPIL
ncbi:MAG: transposase [Desulfobacterota bacterium]|nr:transposase [Thermodesulfobacteriota bacterium]